MHILCYEGLFLAIFLTFMWDWILQPEMFLLHAWRCQSFKPALNDSIWDSIAEKIEHFTEALSLSLWYKYYPLRPAFCITFYAYCIILIIIHTFELAVPVQWHFGIECEISDYDQWHQSVTFTILIRISHKQLSDYVEAQVL